MENTIFPILTLILGMIIGGCIYAYIYKTKQKILNIKANDIINNATEEAEKIKKDRLLEAKEETYKLKEKTESEIKEKKSEIVALENRLINKENNLDKREEMLQKKDLLIEEKENKLLANKQKIQEKEEKMDKLLKEEVEKLEKISGLTREKAKEKIMRKIESDMTLEMSEFIKNEEQKAKLTANQKAKELIVGCMERYSEDVVSEQTVTTINLPNDDMKGRLIGREGRNIRTIESITGVDLIIDDTPEAIVISSFDPLRREIAKITIETLIKDGRIHPTRIEELYEKVCNDINQKIIDLGNETVNELGLSKIDPEIIMLIGKLNYRTSYGQNALKHSIEVANLTGIMAGEIGENIALAKRAGLLHDIGKSIDYEIEGSHVDIGIDVAKKYKENSVVINAIASHHGGTDKTSIISELVSIADTLSAGRPGARSDSIENYIKRLEQLESIGNSYNGVEKTFALQAGRELRVMVKPGEVNDNQSYKIAREIKEKIESEMQYPGTIKITVIRETRVLEEAK